MKKKLTLYGTTDLKKELGVASQDIFYDDKARADGRAALEGKNVYSYALNTSSLDTLDLTDKGALFEENLSYMISRRKGSYSSPSEKELFSSYGKRFPVEIYHYDVIKSYSYTGFSWELIRKYLLGEIGAETLRKAVFRKENTEYFIRSERAKKRVRTLLIERADLQNALDASLREEKMKKIFLRAVRDGKDEREE